MYNTDLATFYFPSPPDEPKVNAGKISRSHLTIFALPNNLRPASQADGSESLRRSLHSWLFVQCPVRGARCGEQNWSYDRPRRPGGPLAATSPEIQKC